MLISPKYIGESDEVVFFEKPSGWLLVEHPWYPNHPDIKSWLERNSKFTFRLASIKSVYHLDPEITGLAFLVKNSPSISYYRNLYGSKKFRFAFRFLVKHPPNFKKLTCDLPLQQKELSRSVRVSHAKGKKCQTDFFEIEHLGGFALWEAQTTYLRLQQIRIHAMEVGLKIVNDTLYGDSKLLYLSDLKSKYQPKGSHEKESPIYDNLSLHLKKVEFKNSLNNVHIQQCPFPKKWEVLYKQIKKYG